MSVTQLNGGTQIQDSTITTAKLASTVTLAAIATANASVTDITASSQKITNLATPTVSTDAATKGYVDNAVTGLLEYKGVIDCSGNPNYPAAEVGDFYVVSVAGFIGGASGLAAEVGDSIICNTANAGGTQAAVGADFNVIQGNIDGAVIGPVSAVSGNLASFDGTTGKLIQDSGVLASSVVVGPASAVSDNIVFYSGVSGKIVKDMSIAVSTDGTLAGNSDSLLPTQRAVKTYVDNAVIPLTDWSNNETLSGAINGVNAVFTLANTPSVGGFLMVMLNGLPQNPGLGNDFTISGTAVTFEAGAIPVTGSRVSATYQY